MRWFGEEEEIPMLLEKQLFLKKQCFSEAGFTTSTTDFCELLLNCTEELRKE